MKGVDRNARMHRLVCVFVARKSPKKDFLASRPCMRSSVAQLVERKTGSKVCYTPESFCCVLEQDIHVYLLLSTGSTQEEQPRDD